MYHSFLLLFIIFVFFISNCTKKNHLITEETLALVNGVSITKKELVRRLELTPIPEFHKPTARNERALDVLIDELVVSQWAKGEGLDESRDYKEAQQFIRDQALIRELYFREIRSQAKPDSKDIRDALGKSLQRLAVQILFTESEAIAEEWRSFLQTGLPFKGVEEKYENDPSVRIDTTSFHWGDGSVPLDIETMAYDLDVGQSSGVLELPQGYGVFFVEHRVQDIFLSSYELNQKRQEVEKVLQARSEGELANRYVDKLLTPLKITQKADGFKTLAKFLEMNLNDGADGPFLASSIFRPEIQIVGNDLSMTVLITPEFSWDGNKIMKLLRVYNYPLNTDSPSALKKSLTLFLRSTVRDHYLAQQASRLGLETSEGVKADVDMWSRYFMSMNGVAAYIQGDTSRYDKEIIADWIEELRKNSKIDIHYEVLDKIELTGIPMLVLWNSDISRQLAVPPLVQFSDRH